MRIWAQRIAHAKADADGDVRCAVEFAKPPLQKTLEGAVDAGHVGPPVLEESYQGKLVPAGETLGRHEALAMGDR